METRRVIAYATKTNEIFYSYSRLWKFYRSCRALFISQSAISQQIQSLESQLQVQLMVRQKRHFELTEAGQYFYRHAKAVLEEIDQIVAQTQRLGEDHELTLRIGYPKNFNLFELQQAITQFCELYPEVKISIVSGTHEELFELLVDGHIDLKVSEQRRAYNEDYYNYELKYSDSYVEIAMGNPLSQKIF